MENEKKCPCCPKGCDLSRPGCPRGEEYAKTGVIPAEAEGHEHGHGPHGHGGPHGDHHGHPVRLQFDKPEQQLVMKYLHHAVRAADHGLTQEQTGEMFAVLSEEETKTLAALLEKLAGHWATLGRKSSH